MFLYDDWAIHRLLELVEADPANARFVRQADRITGHFVLLAIEGHRIHNTPAEEWASELHAQPRGRVLAHAWERDCQPGNLASVLRRLPEHSLPWEAYRHLAAILFDPQRHAIARQSTTELEAQRLQAIAELPVAILQTVPLRRACRHTPSALAWNASRLVKGGVADGMETAMLALLRKNADPDMLLARRLLAHRRRLPAAPWDGEPGITPARTLRDLRRIGERFSNCLRDRHGLTALALGDAAIYAVERFAQPACVEVRRCRLSNAWRITQLSGVNNEPPAEHVRNAVRQRFADAGIHADPVKAANDDWLDDDDELEVG